MKPVIFGMKGETLSEEEKVLFRAHAPAGFILFKRNCRDKGQLRALTDELRDVAGKNDVPIFIDQEGGRVARLLPPHWRKPPPASIFAALYDEHPEKARELVYLNARLIAAELREAGITGNCAPLADIPAPGSHTIIGDRAFGETPEQVADLAGVQAKGLMEGGVLPVLKHIPGHGRATADSHEELPVVTTPLDTLRKTDFIPFGKLAHLPYGMTAHIRYSAIDGDKPTTLSPKVIDLIRNEIGFEGLLMTDDLSMKALSGALASLAKDSLAAGCDLILHCNGEYTEMKEIAEALSEAKPELPAAMSQAQSRVADDLPSPTVDFADLSSAYSKLSESIPTLAVA